MNYTRILKYKGIIFDFNGVLLLDRKWHEQAWNSVSFELRGKRFSKKEAEEHIHGKTPQETWSFLSPESKGKVLRKLFLLKEQHYQKIALSQGRDFGLSPGAKELFNMLKQHGIKFTIATSSPLINLNFYFKHLRLGKWFKKKDVVYDTGRFRSKPAPDMYIAASNKIKVNIKRCIVVDDAKSGIQSARNAKAGKIILFSPVSRSSKPKDVDKVISSLSQIQLEDFRN